MQETLVMTVIGPDRPGLVQLVATQVAEHGGNWLESRMCRLGGQFAGILRVEVPADQRAALESALLGMEPQGLQVILHAGGEPAIAPPEAGVLALVELVGHDRPGILRSVASILGNLGVNVEELASERISAPMGGGTLFQARATVFVPHHVPVATLRRELEQIAADLMVDLKVEPATR